MQERRVAKSVEVVCGKRRVLECLSGKSVAQARQECSYLGIPVRARAVLNGRLLSRQSEARTLLSEGDEICFAESKKRLGLVVTALLLALSITSGMFAYTYSTSSATLSLTPAVADFAVVNDASGRINWQPFGKYRGVIPWGTMFTVTPTVGYTGDLEVQVILGNMDELSKNYSTLMMRLQLTDGDFNPVDAEGITQVLTLENGVVSFYLPSSNITPGSDYVVTLLGGTYIALPFASGNWGSTYNPVIYCQVKQAG